MTGTEIFKRTPTYEKEVASIRLHAPEWKLLLAFDGQRTLAEVVLSADISFVDALPVAETFFQNRWIEEQPITLDQYLKRTGASGITALHSSIPPATVLHKPKPSTSTSPLPSAQASTPSNMSQPAISSLRGPMRLKAVVDYIISTVNNSSLGQLLVYRVFLRIPHELLQAEEIVSIDLVRDTSLVRTAPLQHAISRAVEEVLKRPLPASVFATA